MNTPETGNDRIQCRHCTHRIIGGKDLTAEYPELGEAALYCVTEMHSLSDIESLVKALREVTA